MDALTAWLQKLGLERYTQVFAENEVDLEALRVLGEQDFEKLGVPLGPRKKFISPCVVWHECSFAPPFPRRSKAKRSAV